jgi:glutamate-5-semialdehyde dehydrogenase
MSVPAEIEKIARQGQQAATELNLLNSRKKNIILHAMADSVEANNSKLVEANQRDIDAAEQEGLTSAMVDRLRLTNGRIDSMIKGFRDVADLPDPIGQRISQWIRPNGLEIVKQRVPIGVIGIIYESRPNVTADTAVLCFKTSNATILRGGKEARHSNAAIADAMIEGGREKGLPEFGIQLIRTTDRAAVKALVQLENLIDLIIPRGGEELIRTVTDLARIPVIKHFKGVCHVYVDDAADQAMAKSIAENAKCQRPAVCNAMETLLVHKNIANEFLPPLAASLRNQGVELRGDEMARDLVPGMNEASEADWYEEYLDLVLSIRVVPSLKAAIDHINKYGSKHSDAIVTDSEAAQKTFMNEIDSATVYVNASTRFTDGAEFGMGAEIGVSTDKLHARGPMALEELTSYKYLIHGKGQVKV